MYRLLVVLAFLLAHDSARAQQYVISTVAGGIPPVTPAAAVGASVGDPPRVAVDSAGNVYFTSIHSIFKVDSSGTLTLVAGTGRRGVSGDGGAATGAQFSFPEGLAVDAAGNLYVADRDANVIRVVSASGAISTFAGTGVAGFSGDNGPAAAAQLDGPTGLALDAAGNLYVADTHNNVIRRISPGGAISTVAGQTGGGYGGDGGPAARAFLNGPEGVAVDAAGNLYIADTFNHRIRMVAPDGTISTFAANGFPGYGGDNGPATNATLQLPTDVAVDAQGNVYIADFGTSRVRVARNGMMTTCAGNSYGVQPADGELAVSVRLSGPTGVAVDAAGTAYFAEGSIGSGSGLAAGDFKIWKVSTAGLLYTFAGTGLSSYSGDDGPAAQAQVNAPAGVALDSQGNLYIADTANNRVRRISPDGQITTVAGFGPAGFSGDGGHARSALLNRPMGVAVDSGGNLFIADTGNNRVRKVFPNGIIGTVAGNGNAGFFGDGGNALFAALHAPRAVAVAPDGALYIADTEDHRVRKVVNGYIDTIAGRGLGFGGDGGLAVDALMSFPSALALDSAGNLYIADQGNGRIRQVSLAGIITTVAGDDGSLACPRGVAADAAGNVYFADAGGNRILRLAAGGAATAIAGTGQCCYANDGGPAANASLNMPWGLAVDSSGNVYFADSGNDAIRLLRPTPVAGAQAPVANTLRP